MIEFYKTEDNKLKKLETSEAGCWINLTKPTEKEVKTLSEKFNIDLDNITAVLDDEERARIETEDNHTLFIIDIPIEEKGESKYFSTHPIGIILTKNLIITICTKKTFLLESFASGKVKSFSTENRYRFLLQLLYKNSTDYLQYLKKINTMSNKIEKDILENYSEKEIIKLLGLEKSLVYFSTSIKNNETVLRKMKRLEWFRKDSAEEDLLEDVLIENEQAVDMTKTYTEIITGIIEISASLVNNNLNKTMKLLTSITLIMAIPTVISGIFGMNVALPFAENPLGFIIVMGIIFIFSLLTAVMMIRKKLF